MIFLLELTAWKYNTLLQHIIIIIIRGQQGPVIWRFKLIYWIKCMMKSTILIPHQTVLQHGRIITFLQPLFDQVDQRRTNLFTAMAWQKLRQSQHNCCRAAGGRLSLRSDLIQNRVEALSRKLCLQSSTAITLRTQVNNNLSWLLAGFAQKYWAISIK